MTLTLERLKEKLIYDPETGNFRHHNGAKAGNTNNKGYNQISVDYKLYSGGRLAWFYMIGKWPKKTIDHIDRNASNDAWSNLREADYSQQNYNRKFYNKNGFQGVHQHSSGKYYATINIDKKRVHLGTFPSAAEAAAAYQHAAKGAGK